MKTENQTKTNEFFIVGFSDLTQMHVPLFVLFLLLYPATLSGNLLMIFLICYDSHLHTPMYFFIANLSFIDVSLTTTIFPKLLVNFFEEKPSVTLQECIAQLYIFLTMESVEVVVLTAMAYDRYIAICNPLRYTVIMNRAVCCELTLASLIFGLVAPIPHTVIISHLSFCNSHQINHFFCDITALMKISCTSTQTIETMTYVLGITFVLICFFLIFISYMYIISIIMKIKSAQGRFKGLSTCTSHLTVVILFYGSILFTYMRPATMYSLNQNKMLSLLYCAAVPLFNPIIYSLNNRELREALTKVKRINKKLE